MLKTTTAFSTPISTSRTSMTPSTSITTIPSKISTTIRTTLEEKWIKHTTEFTAETKVFIRKENIVK